MQTDRILYSFRRCPYAMRARLAIAAAQTPVHLREVVLRDKPQAFLDASPTATVPCLVTKAGPIDESLDIMKWALAQSDPEGWLDRNDQLLIETNDGPFKHHLDRYKYATRYDDVDPEDHRTAAFDILKQLDERLANTAYLCGARRGLADIAIFPFIRQFANADRAWFDALDLPALQKWLEGLLVSDLFARVMQKHPQWKSAD